MTTSMANDILGTLSNMSKKIKTDPQSITVVLTRGVENVYPSVDTLRTALLSGKRLRIYNGIDPTGPALHLGHAVVLRKLRQLQDLGHEIILLIGDFTAMIGDPTGKSNARKQLTRRQVLANAREYKQQAGKILDMRKTSIKYNSQWLRKLGFADLLQLASNFTAQQTLARDMFKKRLAEENDLYLHEFMYPMMQAYDSVAMDVDMEIGGSDQMFNMLAGRTLMKKLKNKEKFVLTTKLLVDPTGKKMGKTEGNMVTLEDNPSDTYGKVMSWTDEMMPLAFELLTDVDLDQINKDSMTAPRDTKMRLAREVVTNLLGAKAAAAAEADFISTFRDKSGPTDLPTVLVSKSTQNVVDLFVSVGLVASKSEARRLIEQKGLAIDDVVVTDAEANVTVTNGSVLRKGKRHFVKVVVRS